MKLKTECPKCGKSLNLKPELAGRKIKCPNCSSTFTVDSVRSPSSDASIENASDAIEEQDNPGRSAAKSPGSSSKVGRFEIREKLGEGGFGTVYRAYDPLLDRDTALKVPRRAAAGDERYQRVLQEAKAAASLRHPNIVAVYEVGSADQRSFIASEYVAGRTLAAELKEGQAELRQRIEWLITLCRGLSYAHREGIVHRDVKPHNVLIDENDRAMLADFGLARRQSLESEEPSPNVLVGTPAYMSPEQAQGDQSRVGPNSDQYSLGTILFEILAGRRPFDGNSHSLIASIINEEIPKPSTFKSDVARGLEAISLKALSKDPAARYVSCDAMADDLQRWLDGELVEATRPNLLERGMHWAKKRPHLAGWIAAGVAGLMLLTGATATVGISKIVAANTSLRETTNLLNDSDQALRDAQALAELEAAERAAELQASTRRTEVAEYARTLDQVAAAIDSNRIADAHRLLDRVPWQLRGVEHGLLRRRVMGTPFILHNDSPVTWLTWSHDSRLLATTDQRGRLRFWDGERGTPLSSYELPGIVKAEFHPQTLEIVTIENPAGPTAAGGATQPKVASRIRVWSVEKSAEGVKLELLREAESDLQLADLSIRPQGDFVSVGGRSTRARTGVEIRNLKDKELKLAISPKNVPRNVVSLAYLVDGSALDCLAEFASQNATFEHFRVDQTNRDGIAVSPSHGDSQEMGLVARPAPSRTPVNAPSPAPPAPTRDPRADIAPPLPVVDPSASVPTRTDLQQIQAGPNASVPPATSVYVGGKVLSWNGKPVGQPTSCLQIDAYSYWHGLQDGQIIDFLSSSAQAQRHVQPRSGHMAAIVCMAERPDRSCLASADIDGDIRLWPTTMRTNYGAERTGITTSAGSRVACNYDGTLLAHSIPDDKQGILEVWKAIDGEPVYKLAGHQQGIKAISFHPVLNQLASIDGQGTVFLWDLVDGSLIRQWSVGKALAFTLSFDSLGELLAVGGQIVNAPDNSHLSIWNAGDGSLLKMIPGHNAAVIRAVFVPNSNELLSASRDGTIRRWDVASGTQLGGYDTDGLMPLDLDASESLVLAVLAEPCANAASGFSAFRTSIKAWQHNADQAFEIQGGKETIVSAEFSGTADRLIAATASGFNIFETSSGALLHAETRFPTTRLETRTRTVAVTRPRQVTKTATYMETVVQQKEETRERSYPVKIQMHRSRAVTPVSATIEAGTIILAANLAIRDGTQVLRIRTDARTDLLDEVSLENGVYSKVEGNRLRLFDGKGVEKKLPIIANLKADTALKVTVLGNHGPESFEQTYVETVTETKTESYTVQVPYQVQVEKARTYTETEYYTEHVDVAFTVAVRLPHAFGNATFLKRFDSVALLLPEAVQVVDATIPYDAKEFVGTAAEYASVAVSADGKLVAGIGKSDSCESCGCGTIDVWDAETGRVINSIVRPGQTFTAIQFDPRNGNLIVATGCGDGAWNQSSLGPILEPSATGAPPKPDGKLLVIDPMTGTEVATLFTEVPTIVAMAISKQSSPALAFTDVQHDVHVLRLIDNKVTDLQLRTLAPQSLQISPDGQLVVVKNIDGHTQIVTTESPSKAAILSIAAVSPVVQWTNASFNNSGTELIAIPRALQGSTNGAGVRSAEHIAPRVWSVGQLLTLLRSPNTPPQIPPANVVPSQWHSSVWTTGMLSRFPSETTDAGSYFLSAPAISSPGAYGNGSLVARTIPYQNRFDYGTHPNHVLTWRNDPFDLPRLRWVIPVHGSSASARVTIRGLVGRPEPIPANVDPTQYRVNIVETTTHGEKSPTNQLVLHAEPGEEFKLDLKVGYKTPSPSKLAANLMLSDAGILSQSQIDKLNASHGFTQHFDTESRPGFGSVNGEGEIAFDLTGLAPEKEGVYHFVMNVGLFDKATRATKVMTSYDVTLVVRQTEAAALQPVAASLATPERQDAHTPRPAPPTAVPGQGFDAIRAIEALEVQEQFGYSISQSGEILVLLRQLIELQSKSEKLSNDVTAAGYDSLFRSKEPELLASDSETAIQSASTLYAAGKSREARQILDLARNVITSAKESAGEPVVLTQLLRRILLAEYVLFGDREQAMAAARDLRPMLSELKIVTDANRTKLILGGAGLPNEPFDVLSITLDRNANLTAQNATQLKQLAALCEFKSNSTTLSDQAIQVLKELPLMQKLYILNSKQFTGSLLSTLRLPLLRKVTLGELDNKLSESAMDAIMRMQSLRHLELGANLGLTGQSIQKLSRKESLEHLEIDKSFEDPLGYSAAIGKQTHLRRLRLTGNKVRNNVCRPISELEQLRSLDVHETLIDDAGLTQIASSPLVTLDIRSTPITDAAAESLNKMEHLQIVVAAQTLVGDEFLTQLQGKTSLRELTVPKTNISQAVASAFSAATPNCTLMLDDRPPIWPRDLQERKASVELVSRGLSVTLGADGHARKVSWIWWGVPRHISDSDAPIIALLPEVEEIVPGYGSPMTEQGLKSFQTLHKLETFDMSYMDGLNFESLRWLSNCPIKNLWAVRHGGTVIDDAIARMPAWPSLKSLRLGSGKLTAAGVGQLRKYRNLNELQLRGCLDSSGVSALQQLGALHELTLANNQLPEASYAALARMRGLNRLTLIDDQITGSVTQHLLGLPLQQLTLEKLKSPHLAVPFVSQLPLLESLNIESCNLDDRAFQTLYESMKKSVKIEVRETQVTPQAIEQYKVFQGS